MARFASRTAATQWSQSVLVHRSGRCIMQQVARYETVDGDDGESILEHLEDFDVSYGRYTEVTQIVDASGGVVGRRHASRFSAIQPALHLSFLAIRRVSTSGGHLQGTSELSEETATLEATTDQVEAAPGLRERPQVVPLRPRSSSTAQDPASTCRTRRLTLCVSGGVHSLRGGF